MTYTPEDLGVYDVIVKYAGKDVPGAPFPVKATPVGDATKCRITGRDRKLRLPSQCHNGTIRLMPSFLEVSLGPDKNLPEVCWQH